MMWNLQSYLTTVLNKRMWHFRGSKHTLPLLHIFRGSGPSTPMIYAHMTNTKLMVFIVTSDCCYRAILTGFLYASLSVNLSVCLLKCQHCVERIVKLSTPVGMVITLVFFSSNIAKFSKFQSVTSSAREQCWSGIFHNMQIRTYMYQTHDNAQSSLSTFNIFFQLIPGIIVSDRGGRRREGKLGRE